MRVLDRPDPDLTTGCVLVPTMGALHEGHAALVRAARAAADERGARVVVTVFVNPTQFNDPADFDRYPRDLDEDLKTCADAGADAVFAPGPAVVYPPGEKIPTPDLPEVATRPGLEDAHRPGHFAGVCQVVARLFDLTGPSAAAFGEKDWQQLRVVRAMTAAQGRPVEILAVPTVREPDGLAMSSRNRLLDGAARSQAAMISRALRLACDEADPVAAAERLQETLRAGGIAPEYAVIRDAETLLEPRGRACRALVAARVGGVRLIDNAPWAST